MSTSEVYRAIKEVVSDWKLLGLNLNIPPSELEAIDINFHKVEEKKIEMIQIWMTGSSMPTWSSLVKALLSPSVHQPRIAHKISQQQSELKYFDD